MAINKKPLVRAKLASYNKQVGERLRHERTLLGMSQTDLADLVCLTFQQIQKYEKGANRLSVATAVFMAEKMKIPVSRLLPAVGDSYGAITGHRETLELVKDFNSITDRKQRNRVRSLVKTMVQ